MRRGRGHEVKKQASLARMEEVLLNVYTVFYLLDGTRGQERILG